MVNFSTISALSGVNAQSLSDSTANPTFWQNLGGVLGNLGENILQNTANTALDKATGGFIGNNTQSPIYRTPPIIPQNNTPVGLIVGAIVGLVLLIFKKKK
jgi:hypothetical protein